MSSLEFDKIIDGKKIRQSFAGLKAKHSHPAFIQDIQAVETLVVQQMNVIGNELVSSVDHQYKRMLQEVMNMIFRVKIENGQYICPLIEGKLAQQLYLTPDLLDAHFIQPYIDQETMNIFKEKLDQAFSGKEQIFKHSYNAYHLFTMLSPVFEQGEVVEVVGSSIDITLLEKSQQQVEHLATHDAFTNLPNRRKLMHDLEQFFQSGEKPLSILLCDIDRLKNINDTLGQNAGDRVIFIIAQRLKKAIQQLGTVYRLEGDEFVIVLDGSYVSTFDAVDRVMKFIHQPFYLEGMERFITATIGISYFREPAEFAEDYINRASIAVHHGKEKGGNQVYEYNRKLSKNYHDIILLKSDIYKAFKYNEFSLSYQPKVDVKTNEVVGVEALLRWKHGKKGYISPSLFIPIAEEIGLIHDIGKWVLEAACRQFVEWQKRGANVLLMAVNVSVSELHQPHFIDDVQAILEKTGMDPNYLEMEITENSVMENTEDCIDTMNQLRDMGISLSIDDFGTGYARWDIYRNSRSIF